MSFQEQERALFDLIFDRSLRADFCRDSSKALDGYALEDTEREDFETIRPDALEMDAKMRVYLLLSQWSQSYPVSFSIVSSLHGGVDALREMIDQKLMRTPPIDRIASYGSRLKEWMAAAAFDSEEEKVRAVAILGAEFGMCWAAASLKRAVVKDAHPGSSQAELPADWLSQPLRFSSYVCAVLIPQSYTQLKRTLCPCVDRSFWRDLSKQPLARAQISEILQQEDPRLLVTQATVGHASKCEPTVEYQTVELSEGFAPLFQHIDGSSNVAFILQQLEAAGAEGVLLNGVESGFRELVERGMLEVG